MSGDNKCPPGAIRTEAKGGVKELLGLLKADRAATQGKKLVGKLQGVHA